MSTQVLPVKFTPTQCHQLKSAAKDQGVPMSQFVRDATAKAPTTTKSNPAKRGLSYIADNAINFESELDKYSID